MRLALLAVPVVLLAAPALAQTVYEWTDESGDVHYTDDRSTIPKNAKVRTTQGDDIGVVHVGPRTSAQPARDAGASPKDAPRPDAGPVDAGAPRPARNLCTEHRARLTELEAAIPEAKRAADAYVDEQRAACQQRLLAQGASGYASCMAEPLKRSPELDAKVTRLEEQLVTTREELRRAQVSGCSE